MYLSVILSHSAVFCTDTEKEITICWSWHSDGEINKGRTNTTERITLGRVEGRAFILTWGALDRGACVGEAQGFH